MDQEEKLQAYHYMNIANNLIDIGKVALFLSLGVLLVIAKSSVVGTATLSAIITSIVLITIGLVFGFSALSHISKLHFLHAIDALNIQAWTGVAAIVLLVASVLLM